MTRTVRRYVLAVVAAGAAVGVAIERSGHLSRARSPIFVVLTAFIVAGELLPIRIHRKGEQDEIITSTTFLYALLLTCGAPLALLAQLGASMFSDLLHRKPLWKIAFNGAQYTISIGLATLELTMIGVPPGHPALVSTALPAVMLGALVYFVSNVA